MAERNIQNPQTSLTNSFLLKIILKIFFSHQFELIRTVSLHGKKGAPNLLKQNEAELLKVKSSNSISKSYNLRSSIK